MQGLHKRPGSDVWQGRFRIPSDLWRQRQRLIDLGAGKLPQAQEHSRSTKKHDRDEAAAVYRFMLASWEGKLAAWRDLLANGPRYLDHRQRMALAADHARSFYAEHEAEPFDVPVLQALPYPEHGSALATRSAVQNLGVAKQATLKRDLVSFLREKDEELRRSVAMKLLSDHPELKPAISSDLAHSLEAIHGADTDAALESHNLQVDEQTRRFINFEIAAWEGFARRQLELLSDGELPAANKLEAIPPFEAVERPSSKAHSTDKRFGLAAIIESEVARRSLGKDAKPFPLSSVRKYKKAAAEFVAWRRTQGMFKPDAEDASNITLGEAEKWRFEMQTSSKLSNRTINDKLSCISTIITWGRHLYRFEFHPSGNPLAEIRKLDYRTTDSDSRTYTIKEAVSVLKAARRETEPRRRWLPWICAYSGMRIEEAGQLEVEDFSKVEGRWFIRISSGGGRSLKTASSHRTIPVHPSLEAEGLCEYVLSVGSGRLFASRRIQPHMSEWVREVVGIDRKELSPNHGWRHFFEDMCRLANMPDASREYITGRASGKSASLYGKSELMLPGLAKAVDEVPDILNLYPNTQS